MLGSEPGHFSYPAVAAFVSGGLGTRLPTAGPPAGCPSLLSRHPLRAEREKTQSARATARLGDKHEPQGGHIPRLGTAAAAARGQAPPSRHMVLLLQPARASCALLLHICSMHQAAAAELPEALAGVETGQFNQCI